MKYRQSTKLQRLLERYNWGGDVGDFTEFVTKLIGFMPNDPQPIGITMERYYLRNESQQKDSTGKISSDDKFFYTNLQGGRAVLDTIMSLPAEELVRLVESKRRGLW